MTYSRNIKTNLGKGVFYEARDVARLMFFYCKLALPFLSISFFLSGCRTLGTLPADVLFRAIDHGSRESPQIQELKNPERLNKEQREKHFAFLGAGYQPALPINLSNLRWGKESKKRFQMLSRQAEEVQAPPDCSLRKREKLTYKADPLLEYLRIEERAAYFKADTFFFHEKDSQGPYFYADASYYDCGVSEKFKEMKKEAYSNRKSFSFSALAGSYLERDGVLKDLGKVGPSLGMEFNLFRSPRAGYFAIFSMDHFFDTNSKLLSSKFKDEDYTNFLWGFGGSYRKPIGEKMSLRYSYGAGINFVEIDTNRQNEDLEDSEATRTTLSLIQKLTFNYKITNNIKSFEDIYEKNEKYLGLSLLYYWMPDPLGKFLSNNSDVDVYYGGSLGIYFEYTVLRY